MFFANYLLVVVGIADVDSLTHASLRSAACTKIYGILTKIFYTKQIIIGIFIFSQSKERRKIIKFLRLSQTSEVA